MQSVSLAGRQRNYFHVLDAIRGIAAFFIVFRHVQFLPPLGSCESFLAVDLFFLLSGVVIANSYEEKLKTGWGVGPFMKARVIRLAPVYLICFVFSVIELPVFGHDHLANFRTLITLGVFMIPNLFHVSGYTLYPLNGAVWSLFFEIVVNLFYALIIRRLTNRYCLIIAALGMSIILFCIMLYQPATLDRGFSSDQIMMGIGRVLFSFFVGVFLFRKWSEKQTIVVKNKFYIPVSILLSVALLFMLAPNDFYGPFYELCAVSIVFPILVYWGMHLQLSKKSQAVCLFLGAISYPMYLLHEPLAATIGHVVTFFGSPAMPLVRVAEIFVFLTVLVLLSRLLANIHKHL